MTQIELDTPLTAEEMNKIADTLSVTSLPNQNRDLIQKFMYQAKKSYFESQDANVLIANQLDSFKNKIGVVIDAQ